LVDNRPDDKYNPHRYLGAPESLIPARRAEHAPAGRDAAKTD